MKIIQKKEKRAIIEKYKYMKFYCPYCRTLFDNNKSYILRTRNKYLKFKCLFCKKNFDVNTYTKEQLRGKSCSLTKTKKHGTVKHIENIVTKLWIEGATNNDIKIITHISLERILNITKKYKEKYQITYSFEEFINILESNELNNVYDKLSLQKTKIEKALSVGCSADHITQILQLSANTVSKIQKNLKKESKDSYIEYSQRQIVKIDKEQNTITVLGMDKEQERYFKENNIRLYRQKKSLSPHTDYTKNIDTDHLSRGTIYDKALWVRYL